MRRATPRLVEYVYRSRDDHGDDDDTSPTGPGGYKSALNRVRSVEISGQSAYCTIPARLAFSVYSGAPISIDLKTLERLQKFNYISREAFSMLFLTPVDGDLNIDNVDWSKVERCSHKINFPTTQDWKESGEDSLRNLQLSFMAQRGWTKDGAFTQECVCFSSQCTNGDDVNEWGGILGIKKWSSEAVALLRRASFPINVLDPRVWRVKRTVRWLSPAEQEEQMSKYPPNERWRKYGLEKPQIEIKFFRKDGCADSSNIDPLFASIADIINNNIYPADVSDGMPDGFWGYHIYDDKNHSIKSDGFQFTEDHMSFDLTTNVPEFDAYDPMRKYFPLRQCPLCDELPSYIERQFRIKSAEVGDFAGSSYSYQLEAVDQYQDLSRYGYNLAQVSFIEETFLERSSFLFAMKMKELFALSFRISSQHESPLIFNYDVVCVIASFIIGNEGSHLVAWTGLQEGKRIRFLVCEDGLPYGNSKQDSRKYLSKVMEGVKPFDLNLNLKREDSALLS